MNDLGMQFLLLTVMFFIAALSGLGVGSGGLFVIFLTSFLHFSPTDARVTNLLFFIISSLGAFIVHSMRGKIRYKIVFFVSVIGAFGTVLGTVAGSMIGDSLLKFSFGSLLLFSGFATVFGKKARNFIRFLSSKRKNMPSKL